MGGARCNCATDVLHMCSRHWHCKKSGKIFKISQHNVHCSYMACYRSGCLLETKDNSHIQKPTGPGFSKLVFRLTIPHSFTTTVTKLWCNWTGRETVNANSQVGPNSMLFLTAGDSSRASWTTTSKEGTSSAFTLIMLEKMEPEFQQFHGNNIRWNFKHYDDLPTHLSQHMW